VSRKKLKRGVGGSSDRFIQIPHYMIDSPAWRGLPGDAVKALIQVWRHHNGVNNGEISFACSEAPETLDYSAPTPLLVALLVLWRIFQANP
jgi:hypothetical protein